MIFWDDKLKLSDLTFSDALNDKSYVATRNKLGSIMTNYEIYASIHCIIYRKKAYQNQLFNFI